MKKMRNSLKLQHVVRRAGIKNNIEKGEMPIGFLIKKVFIFRYIV
jgi:hypothetical protein